jgi:LmbE family N-acetylglucosaminyl deacetylase
MKWLPDKAGHPRRDFLKNSLLTSAALIPGLSLIPFPDSSKNSGSTSLHIVCVGAHPDDPESGCGGVLAQFANAGHEVTIVYLTRGEAGIAGKSHEEAAAIRTAEARNACRILKANPVFFGQIDGSTVFDGEQISLMETQLKQLEPDLVITHWTVDSHPDHQVAGMLSFQSWLRLKRKFRLAFFEVNAGYQTMQFKPTHYIDISAVADQKKSALYQHVSQDPDEIYHKHHQLMQQFRGRELGGGEAEAFILLDASAGAL